MKDAKFSSVSAELAVMSELAWHGYNVAQPAVDIGDDIYVYKEDTHELLRVQVKSAQERPHRYYVFVVRLDQLERQGDNRLFYAFAARHNDKERWEFLVIPREALNLLRVRGRIGQVESADGAKFQLNIKFDDDNVPFAGSTNMSEYFNKWELIHL